MFDRKNDLSYRMNHELYSFHNNSDLFDWKLNYSEEIVRSTVVARVEMESFSVGIDIYYVHFVVEDRLQLNYHKILLIDRQFAWMNAMIANMILIRMNRIYRDIYIVDQQTKELSKENKYCSYPSFEKEKNTLLEFQYDYYEDWLIQLD